MSAMFGLAGIFAASIISVPMPPGAPSTDVTATSGTVYQTGEAGQPTQGFLDIQNIGAADVLTGVACPIADQTGLVDASGKALSSLSIPAHGDVDLSVNGPHLLLQDTHFSVQFGSLIPCSLRFANAGTVSVFLYATSAP